MMVYILMGVSGAGKTYIGHQLAGRLQLPFYDADDFHPPENIKKMKAGQPLNDQNRHPWLKSLASHIGQWEQEGGAVLGCSALKKNYREILRSQCECVCFIYLKGTPRLIARRIANRKDHFMPEHLLQSQFKALEEPQQAITVSVDQPPEEIVEEIMDRLSKR